MRFPADNPRSICILRLSAIGDVCHAVAAVQSIQRRWPSATITWVIGKTEAGLIADLAKVRLIVFDKNAGLRSYWKLRKQLKEHKFDVLLHMQRSFRASTVSLCIRARFRVGFDKKRAEECQWLFTNYRIKPQHQPHVLDGFMAFAKAIGVEQTEPQWQMPLSEQNRNWAKEQLTSLKRHLLIAPAASNSERNWLPQRYAAVANYASERGWVILLCGADTPIEQDLARAISNHSQHPPINLVGKTSLKQLLALIERVDLVLSPDTGAAHMAVTVNTPVIGLYAHSNPGRTGPYLFLDYVVDVYHQQLQQQYGKSSDLLPWGKRLKGHHLMSLIETQSVIAKFNQLVKNNLIDNADQ